MKYQQQLDETDCGPACLVMIASHYNLHVTIGKVRELAKTDTAGTNMAGLVLAAKKLNFNTNPMRGTVQDATLNQKFIFPFIAHIRTVSQNNNVLEHYVVVANIVGSRINILDPDASKKEYWINRSNFLKIWTGYVLFLSPATSFVSQKKEKNILLKFLPLVVPHKKDILIISLSSALLIILGIVIAYYYKYITDEVIISKSSFTLTAFSIGALVVALTQAILESLRGLLINHFAYKSGLQLNFSYIAHIFKLPLSFFERRKTGDIISRLADINKIRDMLCGTALSVVFDCALIIIIGPILFKTNGVLFAVSIANIVLMSVIIFFFSKHFRTYYSKQRKEEAEASSSLVEAISGVYTIKALNGEDLVLDNYEKKQMQSVWTSWKVSRLTLWQRFFSVLINGVTGIAIFWVASSGIIKDTFSFGTFLSFNSLLGYFTGPLFRLINIQPQIQEASIAAERVSEILEMDTEQSENANFLKPHSFNGDINFANVLFKYGARSPVYTDLSFNIEKGQWVGFVGASGCGKTTLVKLLLKFYQCEQGTISIDNHNLQDIDAEVLRSRIGYVPQDIYIISGTIAENIAMRKRNATLEEIIEAAKKAGADDFISNLPERYNTPLSEHGTTLSGGEKQRIALARALLCEPDILILDEATSNLDSISERNIHESIEKLRGKITAIIIAHRLTTVKNCDVIFVMDKGNIVESGKHNELLDKDGLYKTMWKDTML